MEMGVLSPESSKAMAGIGMDFPVTDGAVACSPPKMPSRLLRKMSEPKTFSPSSVEEIESKLQRASLRRKKYYEHLSSKARPKPRSPSHSSSSEEDRGQRLEAKLQAAEDKRLSLLANSQMRLAKLDELRQEARNGVRLRFLKERAELGSRVELRVRQAETNRMLILKAYSQRRASLKERTSQSMLRRMARENKYKERVRAAILQKRAAAEKKRLGLLEAEKKKARARILQVQKVAMSMSDQREAERQKMQHKIEDRLQRAKKQREKFLMQRGSSHTIHPNWDKFHQQGDDLSRKLARCWQRFHEQKKTTLNLAKSYNSLNINQLSVKSMPFDQLAFLIESGFALQTTKALLDRLETRYKLSRAFVPTPGLSTWDDIDHLLKRVASPKKRSTPRRAPGNRGSEKTSAVQNARAPPKLSRYQVRVVLCAYMILGHPASVFSGRGERELALAESAGKFVKEIELLIAIILKGPQVSFIEESAGELRRKKSFRSQLLAFDSAWCAYLNSFVLWKVKDAESLVEDLVRAACQLEVSMMRKCKITPEGDRGALTHDLKAIQLQVTEDQRLLKQKVHHLSGDAGMERMESALSDTRSKYFQSLDGRSPIGSPIAHVLAPVAASIPVSPASPCTLGTTSSLMEDTPRKSSVVRRLFTDNVNNNTLGPQSSFYSSGERLDFENEFIVNESVHGDSIWTGGSSSHINSVEEKIKETMKKAFWDGIMEFVEKDDPNFSRVYELMKEVRDEICQMAPESWKQDILQAIDMDILSQVLKSGNLDIPYFGKVLEFALVTLQKLSAPANEEKLKASHKKFLENLSDTCLSADASSKRSQYLALVRGLQFVLEQIQELKQDISRTRIRLLQPLLKGPAGLDYLRKAFTDRYGTPDDSVTSLPLTKQWLVLIKGSKDQEWIEYTTSLTEFVTRSDNISKNSFPLTTLKTGGASLIGSGTIPSTASSPHKGMGVEYLECKGEPVDLLIRLGVIKLAFEINGLTEEGLPETLKLNIFRLRGVQERIQKIIVIATSILILRQTLISEKIVGSHGDTMDNIVSRCVKHLLELLDSIHDTEIPHITELLGKFVVEIDCSVDDDNNGMKLQSIKGIMARMLTKSLQDGDAVFNRLSRVIYLAVRGVVLGGGSSGGGREMAENALRQVGAGDLIEEVVGAASVLLVAAGVSVNVHGPWYQKLVEIV